MSERYDGALICDLDNTLYDWVAYFVPSFYAMVERAVGITGCDRATLLEELRSVHQHHHNSEHPFALLETKSMSDWLLSNESPSGLDAAFRSFNSERKKRLKTYPLVVETLRKLQERNIQLIAYSDSNALAVIDRLTRLELVEYFSLIYCVEGSTENHPKGGPYSSRYLTFPSERLRYLGRHEKKPNPQVLDHIVRENNLSQRQTAYIGDSIAKDIGMALNAGIYAIWAKYGTEIDKRLYKELVQVSHWSAADVKREKEINLQSSDVSADFVCDLGFGQVTDALDILMSRNKDDVPGANESVIETSRRH
jgi:phosphoglycolate phosphatase